MFVMTPEAHLCGGSSVPLGYQYLFGTFSGATFIPWTYPMTSTSRISSNTSLMSATQSSPLPLFTPMVQQQTSPYVSGYGYLQQPNPSPIGNPPLRGYLSSYYPPILAGGNLL